MQAAATDQGSRKSASHHRACAIAWRQWRGGLASGGPAAGRAGGATDRRGSL